MSTRIATSLTLDTQGFQAGISKAEASAAKLASKLKATGVGLFSGKSAAESANALGKIFAAEEKLATFRRQAALSRMRDTEKIAALEGEVAGIRTRVAAIQGVTVEKLGMELEMEEKLLQIERLRISARARMVELESLGAQRRLARETAALRGGGVTILGGNGGYTPPASSDKPGLLGTVGGVLGRTFGVGAIFKGLLAGFGIGTALQAIDGIWGKITEKMEAASRLQKSIAEYAGRAKAALQETINFNRTPAQQLAALKNQERVLDRQLQFAQQDPRVRDDDPTIISRLGAELAENRAKQAPRAKQVQEEEKQRLEELMTLTRQISEERRNRDEMQMTLEEKLEAAKARQLRYDEAAAKAKAGSLQRLRLSLEAEKAITDQVRIKQDITERDKDAKEKNDREQKRLREQAEELTTRRDEAKANQASVQVAVNVGKQDSIAPSLNDLTTTKSGRRNTTALGMAARNILKDEARAREFYNSPNKTEFYDPRAPGVGRNLPGGRVAMGPRDFQARALEARAGLKGMVKSSESNPFAAAEKELTQAGVELNKAAAALQKVELQIEAV